MINKLLLKNYLGVLIFYFQVGDVFGKSKFICYNFFQNKLKFNIIIIQEYKIKKTKFKKENN